MNTKQLVNAAILLAVGTVLHYVIPGIVGGVKPDFMLACVFVIIMISPNTKTALTVAIVSGILAALSTNFPGGQVPSFLDKFAASFAVLFMAKILPLSKRGLKANISKGIIFFLGTLVSGLVFLGAAKVLIGLPGGVSLLAMVMTIVVPTAFANVIFGLMMEKIVGLYKKSLALG